MDIYFMFVKVVRLKTLLENLILIFTCAVSLCSLHESIQYKLTTMQQ